MAAGAARGTGATAVTPAANVRKSAGLGDMKFSDARWDEYRWLDQRGDAAGPESSNVDG
jgi:hypothetical protein